MTLTIKDSLDLTSPGKPGTISHSSENQGSENNAGESPRSNPVCLEVSVTVRSLPGENGDAPGSAGPVREEGRTVIVFDNGAVLRLSKNLPAGQKLIVSNPQGRDVVCRVMNGRNLPSVKGYIEIEFMEQVDDFWRIHQGAEPARVNEKAKVSHPVPAPAVPEHTPPTPVVSPVATPAVRVATREKESLSPSDNAPSFDDIV